MSFQGFRRHPSNYLRKCKPAFLGMIFGATFDVCNRKDRLAEFLADPRTFASRNWLGRFFGPQASASPDLLVSVILATRNNERTLESAVRSLLDQTHRNLDVIVVNDASDDGSVALLEKMARSDARLRVFNNEIRLGTGHSRNRGLQEARGDFVTFQDGDDYSEPDRIARQLAALTAAPGRKLCLCNYVRVDDQDIVLTVNDRRVMKCIVSMMFPRREVVERIGYFVPETVGEDSEYYERIKIAFGKESEVVVFATLYRALFSAGSSLFSGTHVARCGVKAVRYTRTASDQKHWDGLLKRLDEIRRGKRDIYVACSETPGSRRLLSGFE
ncbi:MAG: hypothetical protein DI589_25435 [Shinella sp.]|nr:MAG: hypothetical protein DI589_25435 [Shinella sp.]